MSTVSEERGELGALRTFAVGARVHDQRARWGWGMGAEINVFETRTLTNTSDHMAAALFGLDGSVLSGDGYVRSSTSAGLAVLLEGSEIDEPGEVGFYWDVRPVAFRMQADDDLILTFCPLSGVILVPDPSGIPLIDVQYRVNLSVEFL